MLWLMKDKLAEKCEIKIWETIYNMHGEGLSYEMIEVIVSEVILPNLKTMIFTESELSAGNTEEIGGN